MPSIVELIRTEHREVADLFAAYRDTREGALAGRIWDALSTHAQVEEHVLYPAVRAVPAAAGLVDDALLDHARVKMLVERARSLEGPPLEQVMELLERDVTRHVEEEEAELLPALEAALGGPELAGLGARAEALKQRVG